MVATHPPPPTDDWLTRLQANGYRLTAPRRAVVEIVAQSQKLLSPAEVFQLARKRYKAIGLVTVYRTLEKLEALGLIQRVHQPDGCHSFVASALGHQHLLICQGCGLAEYFSGDDLETLMRSIGRSSGFDITDHWLQLFGLCVACRQTA